MKRPGSASDPLWYKDAVIYELHVRAFFDSNNDGIGDFPGLLKKLDYLQDLGVTCLWLLPFFPSPLRDDGYDISNYTDVHPTYGTMEDFLAFLDAAHERGLQVLIELVMNHTSDQHPWFQRARQAPPGSPERDYYIWSDTDQKYSEARIIFTDTEKSNWTWDPVAQAYFWHRFFAHQPDLNFDNPKVVEEMLSVMRYWLDLGVDALRLDAIPYLVEREGTNCENLPETHVLIKTLRREIDAHHANRAILAEANQWPSDVRPYFGEGDECHMAFHFPLMPRIYMALRQEDRLPITDIMAQTPEIPETCQWALFLRNHDELTLEMVTSDERDYMYLAYSADSRMRVNLGIRRRLAPLMDNNRRRIELLYSLLFSFPGTPVLYYGDEIGMGDNIYLGDRGGVRTPMQWNGDRNAGFSRATPGRLYSPVIMDPITGYEAVNVEAQQGDPSSLLSWMRNMIALRKLFQVFGRGRLEFLDPQNRKVLAYLRRDGDQQVLCVANLSRFSQPVDLDLAKLEGVTPVEMLGYVDFPPIGKQPYRLTLGPYGFFWLELHAQPESQEVPDGQLASMPIMADTWESVLEGAGRYRLESLALPEYLPKQRWFGGKARRIRATRIADWTLLPDSQAALVLVEVVYEKGDPETYFLPLERSFGKDAEQLREKCGNGILSPATSESGPGYLHDATCDENACAALLSFIEHGKEAQARNGSIRGVAGAQFQTVRGPEEVILPCKARFRGAKQQFGHLRRSLNPEALPPATGGTESGLRDRQVPDGESFRWRSTVCRGHRVRFDGWRDVYARDASGPGGKPGRQLDAGSRRTGPLLRKLRHGCVSRGRKHSARRPGGSRGTATDAVRARPCGHRNRRGGQVREAHGGVAPDAGFAHRGPCVCSGAADGRRCAGPANRASIGGRPRVRSLEGQRRHPAGRVDRPCRPRTRTAEENPGQFPLAAGRRPAGPAYPNSRGLSSGPATAGQDRLCHPRLRRRAGASDRPATGEVVSAEGRRGHDPIFKLRRLRRTDRPHGPTPRGLGEPGAVGAIVGAIDRGRIPARLSSDGSGRGVFALIRGKLSEVARDFLTG